MQISSLKRFSNFSYDYNNYICFVTNSLIQVNEIDGISEIEPMTHCLDDFEYELREDEVEESIPVDDLLANCDNYIDTEVKVPKVVG